MNQKSKRHFSSARSVIFIVRTINRDFEFRRNGIFYLCQLKFVPFLRNSALKNTDFNYKYIVPNGTLYQASNTDSHLYVKTGKSLSLLNLKSKSEEKLRVKS